jgi:subtilisin family serine protease
MKARVITHLNIRTRVPAVLPDNNPGYYKANDIIEIAETVTGEKYKGNNVWYKLSDGGFVWSGGVETAMATNLFTSDFWFKELKIYELWNTFQERGENARVLVLDSGINTDIIQIASAVQEPIKNFVPGSTTSKNLDENCHGTHCSSLIAARSNTQFIGAAPNSKLLVGKVTDTGSLDDADSIKNALKEFLREEYEFDIVSISQELYVPDPELESLINQYVAKNKIVIASIGNDYQYKNSNFKRYPGCLDNCISVGSCSNNKKLSDFSLNPTGTSIFCFGEEIHSYKNSATPQPLSGTSQATAIVAGICCLIVSWLKKKGISYNQAFIKQLLIKNSIPLSGNNNLALIQPILIFNQLNKL